jgi:hypothetical protein
MKKIITIPGFKGGLAYCQYDPPESQRYIAAKDIDVYDPDDSAKPVPGLFNDAPKVGGSTLNLDNAKPEYGILASTGSVYFFGNDNSGNNKLQVWKSAVASLGATSTWTAVSASAGNTTAPNTSNSGRKWVAEYKGYLYFVAKSASLASIKLADDTYAEELNTNNSACNGPILTHEGLGNLYFANDNAVSKFDGTTYSISLLTLDPKYKVVSMAPFGRFVMVGVQAINDCTTSKIYIWNGSAATVDDIIDIGDGGLQAIRNVNGVLNILTIKKPATSFPTALRIYEWSGGQVQFVRELDMSSTVGTLPAIIDPAVTTYKDCLFWGFSQVTTAAPLGIDNLIYAYGRSRGGETKFLTGYQLNSTATVSGVRYTNVIFVSGVPMVFFNDGSTHWYINHGYAAVTLGGHSANGVYISPIIFFDPVYKGQIKKVELRHKPLPASTGFRVSIKEVGKYSDAGTPPTQGSFTLNGTGALVATTQSTQNATRTIINSINGSAFSLADGFQIQIELNTVSGLDSPEIIFPILIEVDINEQITR